MHTPYQLVATLEKQQHSVCLVWQIDTPVIWDYAHLKKDIALKHSSAESRGARAVRTTSLADLTGKLTQEVAARAVLTSNESAMQVRAIFPGAAHFFGRLPDHLGPVASAQAKVGVPGLVPEALLVVPGRQSCLAAGRSY